MQKSRNHIHLQAADFVSEHFFFFCHLIFSNIIAGFFVFFRESFIIVQDNHLKCVTLQVCSLFCDA